MTKKLYRTKQGSELPLVMVTSRGLVHVLASSRREQSEWTLCGKKLAGKSPRFEGDAYYARGLLRSTSRFLVFEDKDYLCDKCCKRLIRESFCFPWDSSMQTVQRLQGMGFVTAEAETEERISLSIEEVDQLISMIRRK